MNISELFTSAFKSLSGQAARPLKRPFNERLTDCAINGHWDMSGCPKFSNFPFNFKADKKITSKNRCPARLLLPLHPSAGIALHQGLDLGHAEAVEVARQRVFQATRRHREFQRFGMRAERQ